MNYKSISFIFMLLSLYLVSALPLEFRLNKRSCSKTYKVVKGDTCYKIWTKYGLSESKLRNLNSGLSCSNLKTGTELCVAGDSSSGNNSSCKTQYTIQSGDTCYKIWTKYNLSESSFKKLNSGIDCSKLHKGNKVCVSSSNSSTSTSTPSNPSSSFTWYRECVHSNNYAITFDDGVYKYDEALLDLLKKKGVKATFFINGNNMSDITNSSVRKTIKRMYNEGHNILSHTWSHADLTKLSKSSTRPELKKLEDEIYNIIGKRPKSIRPPYDFRNDNVVDHLKYYGYSYGILWNIDTKDWENKGNVDTVLSIIKNGLSKSNRPIILNHSYYDGISKDKLLKLVEKEIDYLNGKGLKGVNMETCIGHNVYRSSGEGFPN